MSIDNGVAELVFGWTVEVTLANSPCCCPLEPILNVSGSQQEFPDAVDGCMIYET